MNKFKQCTYTVILLLTCIVASPMIFKQIWTTSAEKKKEVAKGTVEIDIHKGEASAEDSAQPTDAPPADGSGQPEVTTLPVTVTDISGSIVTETTETTTVPTTEYAFVEAPDKSYFDDALFIGATSVCPPALQRTPPKAVPWPQCSNPITTEKYTSCWASTR